MSLAIPPRAPRTETETEIVHAIMLAVNATGYARVFRNNVAKLPNEHGRLVASGLAVGSADLVGLVTVEQIVTASQSVIGPVHFGRFLALEVKRPGCKPTEDQKRWLGVISAMGGVAAVVTSVEEAMAVVDSCRRGA